MAQCGWDSVTVDMQHGVQDYQTMVQCFQAMDRLPVTKLVRVPWNEPGIIGKVLDAGPTAVSARWWTRGEKGRRPVRTAGNRQRGRGAIGRSGPVWIAWAG